MQRDMCAEVCVCVSNMSRVRYTLSVSKFIEIISNNDGDGVHIVQGKYIDGIACQAHLERCEEKGTVHGKVKTWKKGFEFDSDSEYRAWHCVRILEEAKDVNKLWKRINDFIVLKK